MTRPRPTHFSTHPPFCFPPPLHRSKVLSGQVGSYHLELSVDAVVESLLTLFQVGCRVQGSGFRREGFGGRALVAESLLQDPPTLNSSPSSPPLCRV